MALTDQGLGRSYKVKLASGRVLGPFDLRRVKLLILKNQIIGKEVGRIYPDGEWVDINQIPEIAELLVAHISGELTKDPSDMDQGGYQPIMGDAGAYGSDALPGATQVLSAETIEELPEQPEPSSDQSDDRTMVGQIEDIENDDKTRVEELLRPLDLNQAGEAPVGEEIVELDQEAGVGSSSGQVEELKDPSFITNLSSRVKERNVAQERTVVFQRSSLSNKAEEKPKRKIRDILSPLLLAGVLGVIGYQVLLEEPKSQPIKKFEAIRPQLPSAIAGPPDPSKSNKLYATAMKDYVADTALGYRTAANKLREAISYDTSNVKALAMLASSYINLIDSSNKDENYFSVLSTLIEMSRAKSVELAETVIADVEFYLIVNKAEAAQSRIVAYTKAHPTFGVEMFYYLALAFYGRGDNESAAKYLGLIPEDKVFSSKIFYLRGQVAEALMDTGSAMQQYSKAIEFNSGHAKSHLRISQLLYKRGTLKDAQPHIDFLMSHTNYLAPRDLGIAYYFHALSSELSERWQIALTDMERAIALDPENHDYLLELYTLRAREGDSKEDVKKIAKMYYFLGEGEKLIKQGKYQDALVPFLEAREVNDSSPLPLLKMGDMFYNLHNIENAKANYKLAADRAPNDIRVWSKYIDSLIESYEWTDAAKAMDRFRKLPVSQSAIDKAAADMNQKQGRPLEAQVYYKKAMSRDMIDSSVYAAYAKSLMSTKNFKDAPFFFSLALRFDPLNVAIKINIAKCVAETESIDRAINMLQDEINRSPESRAEHLAAIAEFQIQKGAWEEAKFNIAQALQSNPDYAYTWKLQAQVYMNQEGSDKTALDNALAAYKSFSERNPSDPSGYLERYKIFARKAQFEKAKEELDRIYSIYPKYPNLHYYLGALYALQGNHKVGAEEFNRELENNPNSLQTLIAYGKELLELGQIQDALNQFTKAMQLNPKSSEAKQQAGWANLGLKNYQAAISLVKSAIELDKANPLLYKRLGLVYRSMNDLNSACAGFRKYLEMEPDATDKADFSSCF
jgi:tetratricopeptide (TPR) repeat protein